MYQLPERDMHLLRYQLRSQPPLKLHLIFEQCHFGVALLDQANSSSNNARASCSQPCELLVSIAKTSAGSEVTCSLGVLGGGGSETVLQPCNTASISGAARFQLLNGLRVFIYIALCISCMLQQSGCIIFNSFLRFLRLRLSCFCL